MVRVSCHFSSTCKLGGGGRPRGEGNCESSGRTPRVVRCNGGTAEAGESAKAWGAWGATPYKYVHTRNPDNGVTISVSGYDSPARDRKVERIQTFGLDETLDVAPQRLSLEGSAADVIGHILSTSVQVSTPLP
jgi:hypothetical protein